MSTLPYIPRRGHAGAPRRRVGGLALLCGAPVVALLGAAAVPQGASIDGVAASVPVTGLGDADVATLRDAFLDEPITLDAGAEVLHFSRRALGARLVDEDLEEALAEARLARGGPFGPSLDRVLGRAGASVRWVPQVDERALFATLAALRARVDAAPSSPLRLRIDDPAEGRPGRVLDLTSAVRRVRDALRSGEPYVELPVMTIPAPDRPVPTLWSSEFAHVLARHTSHYLVEGDSWTRASNLERAARDLDDRILAPGSSLSFNEIVGERTLARGFLPAPEARDGQIVQGIGGGICQVATGIFDAAQRAGLEVLEHHFHSTHEGEGLDAAVAYGVKDLRIRNPYRFPTRLDVAAHEGELRVEIESTFAVPGLGSGAGDDGPAQPEGGAPR